MSNSKTMRMSDINMSSCCDGIEAIISKKRVIIKQVGKCYIVTVNGISHRIAGIAEVKSCIRNG